jgi:hypothetical protein
VRLGGRRHFGYGAGVCMFNQEKRVGTGLKTDLEVRLGHGVRWRMLAKFCRETLRGFEQSAVLNMLWKITPEGAAEAVWRDVEEARKKLKMGLCRGKPWGRRISSFRGSLYAPSGSRSRR